MSIVVTKERLLEKFPEASSFLEKLKYPGYIIEYTDRCDCFNVFYDFSNKHYDRIYIDLEIAQRECILCGQKKKGKKIEYYEVLSFRKPCGEIAEIFNQKLDEILMETDNENRKSN